MWSFGVSGVARRPAFGPSSAAPTSLTGGIKMAAPMFPGPASLPLRTGPQSAACCNACNGGRWERQESLDQVIDTIRGQFGDTAIGRASLLGRNADGGT